MPLKITEAKIEKKVVAFCKKHRLYCRKFTSPAQRGVPDRIIGRNGHVLFLELKSPGNEPTALQTREITQLLNAGLHATWADSYETAVDVIAKTFKIQLGGKLDENKTQAKASKIAHSLGIQTEDARDMI